MISLFDKLQSDGTYRTAYRFTEQGDTLMVSLSVPVIGISGLLSCVVGQEHETSDEQFNVTCRFSVDNGLNWSGWLELTQLSANLIPKSQHWVDFEFSVVKSQPASESYFYGIDVDLTANAIKEPEFYNRSMLTANKSPYYNIMAVAWAVNVLKKVYRRGIVPSFIQRSDNTNWEDEDYINLWWSIIYPIALRVVMVNEFADLLWNTDLLRQYLEQKGVVCGSNPTLGELYRKMVFFYEERLLRGTLEQFKVVRSIGETTVRGEVASLIDATSENDIFTAIVNFWEAGWWLGKTSVCGYRNTEHIADFGVPSKELFDMDAVFGVDVRNSYLVRFEFEVADETEVTFGVKGFDNLGREVSLVDSTGAEKNVCFSGELAGKFVMYCAITPNGQHCVITDGLTSPLEFDESGAIDYIYPYIGVESAQIKVFRFEQNVLTYIGSQIAKMFYVKLRNGALYTDSEIRSILENKFLPIGMISYIETINR